MMNRLKSIPVVLLILFQILPVIILGYFMVFAQKSDSEPGWIYEKRTKCKYFTNFNHKDRTFEWTGTCQDGLIHGYGKLTMYQNGRKFYLFEGNTHQGKLEGKGRLVIVSDGDCYEGNYKNGLADGFGHAYNDDGDHYEGEYKSGLKSGVGTYWYSPESNIFKYVGEWKEGKENGRGTLYYRDGHKVTGHFHNGDLIKESK